MSEQLVHAWTAGIVDGEGCIALKRNLHGDKIYYSLWLTVGQSGHTYPLVLARLHNQYGGNVCCVKRDKRVGRLPSWNWTVTNRNAEKTLRLITSFLVGKKVQAETAIEYRERGMGRGKQQIAESYYWKLRGFKNYTHRGTQNENAVV